MEKRESCISEQEFVEVCRRASAITADLEESRSQLKSALMRGALMELGTSIPGAIMVGIVELLISSGSIFALQIAPHFYKRFLGQEAALVCELHDALDRIREFSRYDLDRALSLSRHTQIVIVPVPNGEHGVYVRT